ncbi:MAG: dCTP deaminase [Candidatus Dojkabacteria bacterium]|uniref:Deoxycytidine triphosphate deaminase n=2 Tax=Candidatus Dojkabacteria TaxID=74243 RepID=A0A136KKT9_9BACT|nr:MAG: Deoxycytidine triphosphate deaminase [candidate division WS6 bacterium OLB21]MBW7953548.1 dCTP deaminase [Candidatus Dojkabacteria bacterium]WKZ27823.1 MAG: dCTP deaminase [Candidatus Dojkabacteria bacterium]
MILSKTDILSRLKEGEITFSPALDGFQLQPHAVDLRLGTEFHIPKTWEITKYGRQAISIDPLDSQKKKNFEKVELKMGQFFELLPKEAVIGTTYEQIGLHAKDIMCVLYPRSSINRRGLSVALSGIVDVGYTGHLMIPIVNNTDQQIIRIYPGERVCQLVFHEISSSLTTEEALLHGLTQPKYNKAVKGFIAGKSDGRAEIDLIKAGKITLLKKKFSIKY